MQRKPATYTQISLKNQENAGQYYKLGFYPSSAHHTLPPQIPTCSKPTQNRPHQSLLSVFIHPAALRSVVEIFKGNAETTDFTDITDWASVLISAPLAPTADLCARSRSRSAHVNHLYPWSSTPLAPHPWSNSLKANTRNHGFHEYPRIGPPSLISAPRASSANPCA